MYTCCSIQKWKVVQLGKWKDFYVHKEIGLFLRIKERNVSELNAPTFGVNFAFLTNESSSEHAKLETLKPKADDHNE